MFDSKTLSREELEERYEQASTILGVVKSMITDESFIAILTIASVVYTKLKEGEKDGTESNLPPGWVVYNGKR